MVRKSIIIFNNYVCVDIHSKTIKKIDDISYYLYKHKIKNATILNLNQNYLNYFKDQAWEFERKLRKDNLTLINYNIIKKDCKVYLSDPTNYLNWELDPKKNEVENIKNFLHEREELTKIIKKVAKALNFPKTNFKITLSATIYKIAENFIKSEFGTDFYYKLFTKNKNKLLADDFIYLLSNSRGSYVHFKKEFKNKKIKKIYSYDINSAFPYFLTQYLPFGKPVKNKFEDVKYADFLVLEIQSYKAIKKTAPLIYDLNFSKNKYKSNFATFSGFWDHELKYIKKFYDLKYKVLKKMTFQLEKNIFSKLVKEFYKYKYTNKNIKFMLNCLIGKFFQTTKIRIAFNNDCATFKEQVDFINNLKFEPYPIQISSFVYSQTRLKLFKFINQNINYWFRSHTDSAIFTKKLNIKNYPTQLGKWKLDLIGSDAIFKNVNTFSFKDKNNFIIKKGREREFNGKKEKI